MPSQLPAFSFDNTVTPSTGRQDKIELHVSMGSLRGSTNKIDRFRDLLASPPKNQRELFTKEDIERRRWIFNRPKQNKSQRQPLEIRERNLPVGEGEVIAPPLFSGKLKFSNYYRKQRTSATTAELTLQLFLNPSRFAHHQRPRFRNSDGLNILSDELRFRKSEYKPKYKKEFPLDETDNWILDTQRSAHFFGSQAWLTFVQNYIAGTLNIIESAIQSTSDFIRLEWARPDRRKFDIKYIENYWEFHTPEPLKIVSLCEPLLRQYSENPSKSRRYKTYQSEELIHNSKSYTVKIKTGIELAIYSKTDKRVRVEVRHKLSQIPEVVGNATIAFSILTLLRKIRLARNNAAVIVNNALSFMRSRNTLSPGSVSVGQFLFELVNAIGSWRDAGILLSMLLENGRIVIDPYIKEQVHILKKAGILQAQLKNRKRSYIATERYLLALNQLAKQNRNLLSPRRRLRTPAGYSR